MGGLAERSGLGYSRQNRKMKTKIPAKTFRLAIASIIALLMVLKMSEAQSFAQSSMCNAELLALEKAHNAQLSRYWGKMVTCEGQCKGSDPGFSACFTACTTAYHTAATSLDALYTSQVNTINTYANNGECATTLQTIQQMLGQLGQTASQIEQATAQIIAASKGKGAGGSETAAPAAAPTTKAPAAQSSKASAAQSSKAPPAQSSKAPPAQSSHP